MAIPYEMDTRETTLSEVTAVCVYDRVIIAFVIYRFLQTMMLCGDLNAVFIRYNFRTDKMKIHMTTFNILGVDVPDNDKDQIEIRKMVETWIYNDIYTKVHQRNSR